MPYGNNPFYQNTQPSYQNGSNYAVPQYQQPVYSPQPQMEQGMIWVDGEIGARVQQFPTNWPANKPLPLWDLNDCVIYLKTMNNMGMPEPLKKLRYTVEETSQQPAMLSGGSQPNANYVTKEDFDRFREEVLSMNNHQNRPHPVEGNK